MASERYPCVNYAKAFPKVSLRTSLRLNLPVLTRYQQLSDDATLKLQVEDSFLDEFENKCI